METNTRHLQSAAVEVSEIFGFFMGFRKDFSTIDYTNNILLRGGLNLGQGGCQCSFRDCERISQPRAAVGTFGMLVYPLQSTTLSKFCGIRPLCA
jgi:hypothetical protein